jgi:RND family efflux transporter MFP subunit
MNTPEDHGQASLQDDTSTWDPGRKPRVVRYLILAVAIFGALAVYGIFDRNQSDADLAKWTDKQAVPSVDLVSPKLATEGAHLTLPADVEAFYTAPIHSQVSGYVRMWYRDIGAHVKEGELLATIDAPELDQQLERAKGELAKAQADYNLAVLTADRWKALRASQAVSQQTADEKQGDALAQKAQVSAAQANLDREKALENFKNIVAPFDGVITARRIDVGALVSSSNTSESGLFDVAATQKMRVYVQVPQIDAASMHKGLPVTLLLPQYPGRKFVGNLDTTSDAISKQSRALLVEALFDNAEGILSPGSYAQAHFDLPLDPKKLVIPSASMIFRNEAPEVAVVKDGKVTLRPISILLDTGPEIEIASGLDKDDKFVASPSDAIETGDSVNVVKIDGKPVHAAGDKLSETLPNTNAAHEASE